MYKKIKVGFVLGAIFLTNVIFAGDTLYLQEKSVIDSSAFFSYPGLKPMVSNDFDTGVIHFFYLRYENDSLDPIYQITSNDGDSIWSLPETASVYNHPKLQRYRAYYPTVDINTNGNIHILYEYRGLPLYHSSWPDYPPSHIAYATNDSGFWTTSLDVINDSAIQTSEGNGSTVSYILRPFLLSKDTMEYCLAIDNAWWATNYHVLFSKKTPGGLWEEGTALYTYNRGAIDKYTIPCASLLSDGSKIYAIWFNRYTGYLMTKTLTDTTWGPDSIIFAADAPRDGSNNYYLIYPMSGNGTCSAVMSRHENYTLNELFFINKDSNGWKIDTASVADSLITSFLNVCVVNGLKCIFYSDNHVNSKLVTYSSIDGFSSPVTILTSDGNPVRWITGVGDKIVWLSSNPSGTMFYLCSGNVPPIGVAENDKKAYNISLLPNSPNPFNSRTLIRYAISREERIKVSIYNIQGQLVRTLENGVKKAGNHTLIWDGMNNAGMKVNSGIYFYQLKTAHGVEASNKMLLLR